MRFVNATISHEFEIVTEGGVSFKSPKVKDGKISHQHLGFMMDSQLSGSSHETKMRAVYLAELSKIESIYKRMGETMALWYLSTTAGPKVMYGSEMIPDRDERVHRLLNKWWLDMVSKAVGVSSVKDNTTGYQQRETSYVSMRSLAKETFDPPWGVTHSLKKVGLLSRVSLYTDSMASARAHGSVAKGSLWLSMVEARKSLKLAEPRCYTTHGWKEATKVARKGACHSAKKLVTEPLSAGRGDYLGMVSYQTPPGQSFRLEKVVPSRKHRRLVRRLRLGMIGDTRV